MIQNGIAQSLAVGLDYIAKAVADEPEVNQSRVLSRSAAASRMEVTTKIVANTYLVFYVGEHAN